MSIETFVKPMRDHRAKLDGDTGTGGKMADAFGKATSAFTEMDGRHDGMVRQALGGWDGKQAGLFQDRTRRGKSAMATPAENSTAASSRARAATSAGSTRRGASDGRVTAVT